jgi:hypothetical protein
MLWQDTRLYRDYRRRATGPTAHRDDRGPPPAQSPFGPRLGLAGIVELDEADGVAVGTEGEIVFEEVEQALAIVLVAPGGEAIERAAPNPLVAALLFEPGDQLGAEPVAADRDEAVAAGGKRSRGLWRSAACLFGRAWGGGGWRLGLSEECGHGAGSLGERAVHNHMEPGELT